MIKKFSSKFWIMLSVMTVAAVLVSLKFLDSGLALRVMKFLQAIHKLHKPSETIPDILSYLVIGGTVLMWIIYFYRAHKKKIDVKEKFLQLAATTLPVSYVIKTILQLTFGRTSPRDWLLDKEPLKFNWLNHFGAGGSFPSGHMTVFAAFGTAVYIFFPQYRKLVLYSLLVLGAALIGTDYHFLSDVIAGAYLGFFITYLSWRIFEKMRSRQIKNYN